jgi:sulfite exporter TauE/SafE
MLAFGVGTLPALLGVGFLARLRKVRSLHWPRQIAALTVFLFATQMALRGFAAWGWVEHFRFSGVMLW